MAEMRRESLTANERASGRLVRDGLPRAVEVMVALTALVALSPLLAVAAFFVVASSRGPVLFRQKRVGRGGRDFVLYKLRTMRVGFGGLQVTAGDDARVTRVGKFLRRAKLDELPELWNVVKGDMSLVGPRPEVPCYVDLDNPAWRAVLAARPGLTDPITLRLRNEEALLAGVEGDREKFYTEMLQPFKLRGYLDYLCARDWRADTRILWQTCQAIAQPSRTLPPTDEEIKVSLAGEHAPE